MEKIKVLFLCTHNSCRSQMAEGLLRSADSERFEAFSAGREKTKVHPLAIRAMNEVGIGISNQTSKTVGELSDNKFDYVISMCAGSANAACPNSIGDVNRLVWSFDDPSIVSGSEEDRMIVFRRVRDEIKNKLEKFVENI